MYILDTNICIYAIKGMFPKIKDRLLEIHPDSIKISSVTEYELAYGVAKSKWGEKSRNAMQMFISSFEVLPFDATDSLYAGLLRAELERKGTPIGSYDIMIAAQCLSRGLTLITHNVKEFQRVPNITIEDWTE